MSELIESRLNKIKNLENRKLLKDVLYDVFDSVQKYNLQMYDTLEQRIYNEIDDPLGKFYIYTSIMPRDEIDPISDFMHPIVAADTEHNGIDIEAIELSLQEGQNTILQTLFLQCDNQCIKKMTTSKFSAQLMTKNNTYDVELTVVQSKKYIKEIENLYKVFKDNSVVWNTINCPHIFKYVDVSLDKNFKLQAGEKLLDITFNLADYEPYVCRDLIPVWNIQKLTTQDKTFPIPVPAKDFINYDHKISLAELGEQNGYMIDIHNEGVLYCKREQNELIIVSSLSEQTQWKLVKIENRQNDRKEKYKHRVFSNSRNLGFVGRYSTLKALVVRTKAEISRIFESYDSIEDLELYDVSVKEVYNKPVETINFNSFVDDEIRIDKYKKVMLVQFSTTHKEDYLIKEKMSFLVSELQVLFPEYKCVGELI